jgi:hypothetical protein
MAQMFFNDGKQKFSLGGTEDVLFDGGASGTLEYAYDAGGFTKFSSVPFSTRAEGLTSVFVFKDGFGDRRLIKCKNDFLADGPVACK